MWYPKSSPPLICMTVVLLFLAGCSAPAATALPTTAIPPTAIPPTAIPPTAISLTSTSLPATAMPPTPSPPVLITSVEELIGNWQPLSDDRDAMFLQINADGTCRQSNSLEGLSDLPQVECTYQLEGADLSLTVVELHGVPACPSPTAKYEVRLIADDQIQLVLAADTCAPRIRSTQGMYRRLP